MDFRWLIIVLYHLVQSSSPNSYGTYLSSFLSACSRQKKLSDDRQHYDKWTVWRYEKEGLEEGRVENAKFALKDLPWAEHCDWLIDWLLYSWYACFVIVIKNECAFSLVCAFSQKNKTYKMGLCVCVWVCVCVCVCVSSFGPP